MPYEIGSEPFSKKYGITERCRLILYGTSDGELVAQEDLPFLFELFQHHDEWRQKSGDGVSAVATQTSAHGTRGFVLIRQDGSSIDISFPHAIKLILR